MSRPDLRWADQVLKEGTDVKVTLDLDKLLDEQHITREEYDKLLHLGARSTATLAFNILVGFGVVAVSAATLALVAAPATAITLGTVVCAAGIGLLVAVREQWRVLANTCVVLGALMFGVGMRALNQQMEKRLRDPLAPAPSAE